MPGGGGGGSDIDPEWAQTWYDVHYDRALKGQEEFTPGSPDTQYYGYGQQGFAAGTAARQQDEEDEDRRRTMSEFMEGFASQQEELGAANAVAVAEAQAKYQKQYDEQIAYGEEQRIIAGQGLVKDLAVARGDAYKLAKDFVSDYVNTTKSQMKMTGQDFDISDAEVVRLTGSRFADLWGEKSERTYIQKYQEFGGPYSGQEKKFARGTPGAFKEELSNISGFVAQGQGGRGGATASTPALERATSLTTPDEDELLQKLTAPTALGA